MYYMPNVYTSVSGRVHPAGDGGTDESLQKLIERDSQSTPSSTLPGLGHYVMKGFGEENGKCLAKYLRRCACLSVFIVCILIIWAISAAVNA